METDLGEQQRTFTAELEAASRALRELHRELLGIVRKQVEDSEGTHLTPAELFRRVVHDLPFAWLRTMSEMIVDIDELAELEPAPNEIEAAAVRHEIERLLFSPPGSDDEFGQRYSALRQSNAQLIIPEGELRRQLAALPKRSALDAADELEERHRWNEKRGRRTRRPAS
jgi:hypothetical protein